jgi:hypothetical protein
MKVFHYFLIAIALILLFGSGMVWGAIISNQEIETNRFLAIQTCEYANNLTRIVNVQTDFIESSGIIQSETPLTQLNYLNCSKLQ